MSFEKPELLEYLVSRMKSYVDSNKTGANKANLAVKTGLSRATICKYLQDEVTSCPSAETAFKILRFFDGNQKSAVFLKEYFPDWWKTTGQFLSRSKSIQGSKGRVASEHQSVRFPFNKVHMKIFEKAMTANGVSDQWIVEHFGKSIGLPAKEELLHEGYIERQGTAYKLEERFVEDDIQRLAERVKIDCEAFPVDKFGQSAFMLKSDSTISAEARKNAVNAIKQCVEQVREIIMTDEESESIKEEFLKINIFGSWTNINEV